MGNTHPPHPPPTTNTTVPTQSPSRQPSPSTCLIIVDNIITISFLANDDDNDDQPSQLPPLSTTCTSVSAGGLPGGCQVLQPPWSTPLSPPHPSYPSPYQSLLPSLTFPLSSRAVIPLNSPNATASHLESLSLSLSHTTNASTGTRASASQTLGLGLSPAPIPRPQRAGVYCPSLPLPTLAYPTLVLQHIHIILLIAHIVT